MEGSTLLHNVWDQSTQTLVVDCYVRLYKYLLHHLPVLAREFNVKCNYCTQLLFFHHKYYTYAIYRQYSMNVHTLNLTYTLLANSPLIYIYIYIDT